MQFTELVEKQNITDKLLQNSISLGQIADSLSNGPDSEDKFLNQLVRLILRNQDFISSLASHLRISLLSSQITSQFKALEALYDESIHLTGIDLDFVQLRKFLEKNSVSPSARNLLIYPELLAKIFEKEGYEVPEILKVTSPILHRISTDNKIIDYDIWIARNRWTPAEAACLLKGKDPDELIIKHRKVPDDIEDPEAKQLFEVIKTWCTMWAIFSESSFWYIDKALFANIEVPIELLTKTRKLFLKKFEHNPQEAKEKFPNFVLVMEIPTTNKNLDCPFCQYSTRLLKITGEAIQKFWASYDPQRPPRGDHEIIPWLKDKGATPAEATAIDKIIRPESRKKGGQTKINKPPKGYTKKNIRN